MSVPLGTVLIINMMRFRSLSAGAYPFLSFIFFVVLFGAHEKNGLRGLNVVWAVDVTRAPEKHPEDQHDRARYQGDDQRPIKKVDGKAGTLKKWNGQGLPVTVEQGKAKRKDLRTDSELGARERIRPLFPSSTLLF